MTKIALSRVDFRGRNPHTEAIVRTYRCGEWQLSTFGPYAIGLWHGTTPVVSGEYTTRFSRLTSPLAINAQQSGEVPLLENPELCLAGLLFCGLAVCFLRQTSPIGSERLECRLVARVSHLPGTGRIVLGLAPAIIRIHRILPNRFRLFTAERWRYSGVPIVVGMQICDGRR